jgi:hypothetical protein
MRFLFIVLMTAILGVGLLPTSAYAWPDWIQGEPDQMSGDDAVDGIFIWEEKDRIEVRVRGDQRYTLTIWINYGELKVADTFGLDGNDKYKLNQDKSELVLDIAGSDEPEGISIKTEGNRVHIKCKRDDGDDCSTDDFYLGSEGRVPDDLPLHISRKDD